MQYLAKLIEQCGGETPEVLARCAQQVRAVALALPALGLKESEVAARITATCVRDFALQDFRGIWRWGSERGCAGTLSFHEFFSGQYERRTWEPARISLQLDLPSFDALVRIS